MPRTNGIILHSAIRGSIGGFKRNLQVQNRFRMLAGDTVRAAGIKQASDRDRSIGLGNYVKKKVLISFISRGHRPTGGEKRKRS